MGNLGTMSIWHWLVVVMVVVLLLGSARIEGVVRDVIRMFRGR